MAFLGKVLYYLLFYLVLAVIICSFCGSRTGEREMLGREAGRELKGIAILMVLLGHLAYIAGYLKLPVTPALGAPAVDIFLFLSAFGLMNSYAAKGLKGFIGRRLAVVLPPYIFTTLLKFLVMPPAGMGWTAVVTNLLPINTDVTSLLDTSMWYVQYILLCYAVFYLVFLLPKPGTGWKAGILFVIGTALAVYSGGLFYRGGLPYSNSLCESYSHHLSFPLGALFYLVYDRAKKISWKIYSGAAVLSFVIFQFAAYPGIDGYVKYYINNICYIIFFISVFAVLKYFGLRSGLLQRLGDLSYYIYLNEFAVLLLFFAHVPLPGGVNGLLILLSSVAAAVPVKLLCELALKKLKVH